MRRLAIAVLLLFALPLGAATVTIVHFSDYHSHALPFYSEGKMDQGGIARAIGFLRSAKRGGALVFDGGDMINKGAPAWSDKYGCIEWPWLNGIVDAMALGNHDADYGPDAFARCRLEADYPILSANTDGFKPYAVFTRGGVRVGVFAVAGDEFPALTKQSGFQYADRLAAARSAVEQLRTKEKAAVVVMIGHETTTEDMALAHEVKGIDVIFGTHSHEKHDLQKIAGTSTWFISPAQYLTYVSRVQITVEKGRVKAVKGGLVRMGPPLKADEGTAARVEQLQADLENDPKYAALFKPVGKLAKAIEAKDLAQRTLELMKESANADLALSTVSSFRQALPAGKITPELLRAALPYDNELVACELTADRTKELLEVVQKNRERDPAYVSAPATIDDGRTYRIATTDYLARTAEAYRDFFTQCKGGNGVRVRELVRDWLAKSASQ